MFSRVAAVLAASCVLLFSTAGRVLASEPQISASAAQQIVALKAISRSRSGAETKLDSRLHLALLQQRGDTRMAAFPQLRVVKPDANGRLELDVTAARTADTKAVLAEAQRLGGVVGSFEYRYRSLRISLPVAQVLSLAAHPGVLRITLAGKGYGRQQPAGTSPAAKAVNPPRRAINVSQGDIAHRAAEARSFFGARGQGVKICVLSDGVDSLATLQASGDLPPMVQVLPGQAGSGDEGSAMLEIIHDLAPDAALGFATALTSEASFAQNILDLRTAGCDILVDDILYLAESPFQDGIVATAVNTVTASGALYFSSAGNEGNLNDASTGTWEGNFLGNGTPASLAGAGLVHDFTGAGSQSQLVTANSAATALHWVDPSPNAANDYDLYILNGGLTTIFDASTDTQDGVGGDDFAAEVAGGSFVGERIVVAQFAGTGRMLNVNNFRGQVETRTAGCTRGHSAAANAFSVAAVDVAAAVGGSFAAGNPVETFSCDGPRRIFFDVLGNLLSGAPAANFSATGGVVRQKPDIAAADGVATAAPGFNPFFGTSAAAPHAAAIAGLLKSAAPALTPTQIRGFLTSTAIDIEAAGVDRDSGAGIVMAFQALQGAGVTPIATLDDGVPVPTQLAGDGDAFIEPNEDWRLNVPLINVGGATATAISAVLSSSTPGVSVVQSASAYANLAAAAGGNNTTPYVFSVNSTAACGAVVNFALTVTYSGGSSPQTFNFSLQTGNVGTPVTVSYSGPAVPIPDGGDLSGTLPGLPVVASLPVAGVGTVIDVDLRIDGATCNTTSGSTTVGIDHSFVNDLELTLVAPGGSSRLVVNNTDGSGNNFCQTMLDDQSAGASIQSVVTANAPFTGSFLPNLTLSAFSGLNANGNWGLQAQDFFSADTGNIRAFSLVLTPAVCDAPVQPPVISATKVVSGGTQLPGGTVIYTITLSNTGGVQPDNAGAEFSDLLPATLTVGTPTASSGSVSGLGVNPVTWNGAILPGTSVTITIPATISGAASGMISNQGMVNVDADRNGSNETAVLTDDPGVAGNNNPTVFIAGIGQLTITPATVMFASQTVGTTSAASTVTLANTGTAALDVTALTAATAPFARSGGTCANTLPISLAVGANCTLTYTFAPTATGPFNQSLTVTANAPGSGTIGLSGTGTQGTLTITPAAIPFGNQAVGTTSAATTVTLANTGTASLDVIALTAAAAPFARSGGTCANTLPISIAAGANCTLTYTFAPTATGPSNQTLTVTANAPGSGTIGLSGTGTQGTLTITPAAITFANQNVGSTSAASTVTLANTGTAALNVTALTAATAPFARSGGTCANTLPISIAAGANCTLTYTFAPSAAVASSQPLTVTANAPGSGTIALSGTGTAGVPGLSTATLDFQRQVVGTTATRTLTLSNTGNGALQVTAISAAAAPFALTAGGTCASPSFSLAAGSSCTLVYSFNSSAEGLFQQTVNVTTDFGNLSVLLRGSAQASIQIPTISGSAQLLLLLLVIGMGTISLRARR